MQSKKINELATNLTPAVTDLLTIGDPSTGQLKKVTLSQISGLFGSSGTVSSIATTAPLTGGTITTSGTLGITQATTSANGYLSSTDWNTFNGKQAALNGTGFIKISGTTISYDNSSYYLASNPSSFISRTSLSFVAGSGAYNSTTGVITIPTNNNQITNGSGFITSSALSSYLPLSGGTLTGTVIYNVGDGINWFVSSVGNGAELRLKTNIGAAGYTNRSGALAWKDNSGNRTDVLGWTNDSIIANQPLSGTSAIFSSTISASNFSGSSSGSNTGDQTLSGLGGQPQLNGTGFVKASGTTISYDNSTYLTSITSANVTTALGYTPYNNTNPAGYITSAGSVNYATSAGSISGYNNPTTAGSASTIAYRDTNGYLYAVAFFESSDIRFKNVLETNPIIDLYDIEVIKFNRKDNASIRYGYSAQQVKEFLPDAVSGESELVVNYSDVHTLKIAALERRILELENKLK